MMKTLLSLLGVLILAAAAADSATHESWLVNLDARRLGPVQFHLQIDRSGSQIHGRTVSGLLSISASRLEDGSFAGQVKGPSGSGEIFWNVTEDGWQGRIKSAIVAGDFVAQPATAVAKIRDYPALLDSFDVVVESKIYAPTHLDAIEYQVFRKQFQQVATIAHDDLDLLLGFQDAWQGAPFSHFELRRSSRPAADMFAYFDTMRVGFEAATVEFDDDVAVLKVRTMMGIDTIEQIQAAYQRIAEEQPNTLIIDLRGNTGGAFAVKPLVEHIIDEPLDAGYFLSQVWNRHHNAIPVDAEVLAAEPWEGWSIVAFWEAVQEADLLRIQFKPAQPNFDGQVFVLLDRKAASATEMAADALSASGLVTVIGEPSAGEMLSQSMFDIGDGFIVSLPVADYYSFAHGRIEGSGVAVDIETDPDEALATAQQMIQ